MIQTRTPSYPPADLISKELLQNLTATLTNSDTEPGTSRSEFLAGHALETRLDKYGSTLYRLFRGATKRKANCVAEWRPRADTDGIYYQGIAPYTAGEIKEAISEVLGYPPQAIRLFGSRIRGYHTATSDLDVAVMDGARMEEGITQLTFLGFTCEVRYTDSLQVSWLREGV